MGMSQEVRDFINGFSTMYKTLPDPTEQAYQQAEIKHLNAETANAPVTADMLRQHAAMFRAYAQRAAAQGTSLEGAPPPPGDFANTFDLPPEDNVAYPDSASPTDTTGYAMGGAVRVPHIGAPHPVLARLPHASMPHPGMLGTPAHHPQAGMVGPGMQSMQPHHPAFVAPGRPPRQAHQPNQQQSGMMGAIPQFAEGGAVEGDYPPSNDTPVPSPDQLPQGMSYTPSPDQQAPSMGAIPVANSSLVNGQQGPSMEAPDESEMAHQAVLDGLTGLHQQFGLDDGSAPIHTPQHDQAATAYHTGVGGADPQQVMQVQQMVDPHGQLPESVRNMRALAWGYQYFMSQGKPKQAQAYAGQLLQTYRQAYNRFNAIAQAAASNGHVDTAARAALKAYAYVPDGQDIQIQKTPDGRYAFNYKNDKGQTVQQGLLTPDEVLQHVTNMGMGNYDDLVSAAAGNRYYGRNGQLINTPGSTPTAGTAGTAEKVPGGKSRDEALNVFEQDGVKEWGNAKGSVEDDDLNTMNSAAGHIYANNNVTKTEARGAVKAILSINPNNPTGVPDPGKAPPFKVLGTDANTAKVEVNNQTFNIPKAQFMQLMAMRSAEQEKATAAATKAGETARRQQQVRGEEKDVINKGAQLARSFGAGMRARGRALNPDRTDIAGGVGDFL